VYYINVKGGNKIGVLPIKKEQPLVQLAFFRTARGKQEWEKKYAITMSMGDLREICRYVERRNASATN
jgi:hypothetical protein